MSDQPYAREGEDRTRIVRKGDLDDAVSNLRREMTWKVLVGSGVGSAIAGLIGALASGGSVAPTVQALGSMIGL